MGYRARHFGLQELVCPEIYKARGERAWELLDDESVAMLDGFRDYFGKITVNDYEWGGTFKYSGLRPLTGGVGAPYSMHRYGRAFDCKPKEVTVLEMYNAILAKPEKFPLVRALENIKATPTWLHADRRNHMKAGIWVVNP